MTPLDRAALAAALKDATPEMLREAARMASDAAADQREVARYVAESPARTRRENNAKMFDALAALALACADLEENGRSVLFGITKTGRVVLIDEDGAGYTAKGDTLPRALAALLKGDQ